MLTSVLGDFVDVLRLLWRAYAAVCVKRCCGVDTGVEVRTNPLAHRRQIEGSRWHG